MSELKAQSADSLCKECEQDIKKTAAKFKHKKSNNTITIFDRPGYGGYEVDLDRITEPLDLLSWTIHLNEKCWFDRQMLNHFVVMVCNIKGWNAYK